MLELQCHDLLGVQCRAFMNFLWVSTIFKRNGHTQQTICTVGEQKHLCTLFCSCSDSCRTTMKLALTVKIHWWKQWRSNWCDRGHNICDRGSKESNSKTFFISLSLSLSGDAAVAQLVASRELLAQCRTSKDSGKATFVGSGGLYCTEDQNATFCGNMTLWKTLTTC